jgi:quercetin dioxygenase-like cupin family protein
MLRMEEIMTARSVAWDTGEAIPGSPFRHMITAADTGGRFSTLSVVLGPGDLVLPHSHRDEDEFSLVFRGRIGGRIGDHDVVVEEGGFLFKLRGIVTQSGTRRMLRRQSLSSSARQVLKNSSRR